MLFRSGRVIVGVSPVQGVVWTGPGSGVAVVSRARSSLRRILPDADFGIASTNSTARTFLYGATRSATNAVTSAVHDRMPVILAKDNYDLWLDPGMNNVEALGDFLKPFDAALMRSYPVSSRINHAQNDDADCTTAVELGESQHELFS